MHSSVAQGPKARHNSWLDQITSDRWPEKKSQQSVITPCPHWHTAQLQFTPCTCIFCHVLCYVCKCLTELGWALIACASVRDLGWCCASLCTALASCWCTLLNQNYLGCIDPWRGSSTICFLTWIVCCVLDLVKQSYSFYFCSHKAEWQKGNAKLRNFGGKKEKTKRGKKKKPKKKNPQESSSPRLSGFDAE